MRTRQTIACCALLLLWAVLGIAQELRSDSVSVRWKQGVPALSFSLESLADDKVKKQLSSGLKKRFSIVAQAYRKGSSRPIATREFSCAVTYDLWEEMYLVRIGGTEKYKSVSAAIDRCLSVRELLVGNRDDFKRREGQEIYFAIRGEFNPISKQQCKALVRPGVSADPMGPLVVNIVRRQICVAERVKELRSEKVFVVE